MGRKALLVIDMPNDFVADNGRLTIGKAAQETVPYIAELCQKTLDEGGVVVFPTDNHVGGKDAPFPDHCDPATDGVKLYGAIGDWYEKNSDTEKVHYLPKTKFSAFHKTGLADLLRGWDVDTVELVGVCTDICDLATAFDAHYEGFKIRVHKRGVATFSPHGSVALDLMKQNFGAEVVE